VDNIKMDVRDIMGWNGPVLGSISVAAQLAASQEGLISMKLV
jgi:hypothetical protein